MILRFKKQKNLRVRIKYDKSFKHYKLTLQKKFVCFWFNTDWFVYISERNKKDHCEFPSPVILRMKPFKEMEIYNYGKINFKKRGKKLCKDYLNEQSVHARNKKLMINQ